MENILYNISQVLGITIIHSLWQGLLIYFLLKVILLAAGGLSPAKKYLLAVSSLFAITAWFCYTLFNEIQVYDWLAEPENLAGISLIPELPASLSQFNKQTVRYYYSIEGYLPYITLLYVTGLILNTVRIILARKKIGTIKTTMSIDVPLQQQISRFAEKLGIVKKIKVGLSRMVDVPCIVGYAKPVILLPFTLSTYLEADEIEAILMHEIAHIKRNDYLVNLAQQVITTLLFFNPCVLLINKIIGEERENSCDDLVVGATQKPVIYAKALFKLEQNRQNELQLALAVTGKKYHLLNRIERIMKTKKHNQSIRPTLVAMLVLGLSVGSLALLNPKIAQGKISVKAIKPALNAMLADTLPKNAPKAQKAAAKATARDAKGTYKAAKANRQRPYGNDVYYNNGIKDTELEKLSADVQKHADAISKYYDSDAFKALSADMEKRGKEMEAYYDSPRLKELVAAQAKLGADMEKRWGGKNTEMDGVARQMEAAGKEMEKYFNSPSFKEMNARLEKKYGVTRNGYHDNRDENYKKYQDELNKNLSPEIKQQTEQMKKLGEQISSHYASPEMKMQTEQIRKMGDSIRKAFQAPAIKQQQEEMRAMGDKMRAYAQSPEMKRQQEQLKKAAEKLKAYTNSPAFKEKVKEWKKAGKAYNLNINNNIDRHVEVTENKAVEVEATAPAVEVKEIPAASTAEEVKEVPIKP